jgi:hypothetical protein
MLEWSVHRMEVRCKSQRDGAFVECPAAMEAGTGRVFCMLVASLLWMARCRMAMVMAGAAFLLRMLKGIGPEPDL